MIGEIGDEKDPRNRSYGGWGGEEERHSDGIAHAFEDYGNEKGEGVDYCGYGEELEGTGSMSVTHILDALKVFRAW